MSYPSGLLEEMAAVIRDEDRRSRRAHRKR